MNFLDWNGSGRLDPQDLVTSEAVKLRDQRGRSTKPIDGDKQAKDVPTTKGGCLGSTAFFVIALISASCLSIFLS